MIDRQTDRNTDRQTDRHTDRQTEALSVMPYPTSGRTWWLTVSKMALRYNYTTGVISSLSVYVSVFLSVGLSVCLPML